MTRSADFALIVRNGRRVRSGTVVVHSLAPSRAHDFAGVGSAAPRIGLIVSRSVGGSVERHRVSRRLQAQLAARLDRLPAGGGIVVRALPGSCGASSAALGADLDVAIGRLYTTPSRTGETR